MNKYYNEYLCTWDDGHDIGTFTFFSWYRAGSQKNREDAKSYIRLHYNYKKINHIKEICSWNRGE